MEANVQENYIGEILMQTKTLPAKLWDFVITDKGFHLVFFLKTSPFEVIIMLWAWFFILWAALYTGMDRFIIPSLFLLVVAIYGLNRYRIQNRWKNLHQVPVEKKLYSDQRNIHIPKSEIKKIVVLKKGLLVATEKRCYRFSYFENLNKQFKHGIDPFEKQSNSK